MPWQPDTWVGRVRRGLRRLITAPRLRSVLKRNCPHCARPLVAEFVLYPADPQAWGPCPCCGRAFPLFDSYTPRELLTRIVRRHSRLDERRLVVLSSADGLEISSIPSGILFVMATWSVQALSSFRHLNEVLSRLDLGALKVFVVDIDDFATELVRQLPGLVLGGYGETFWIRGGAISYALSHCNSQLAGVVEDYTRAIVGEASHPG